MGGKEERKKKEKERLNRRGGFVKRRKADTWDTRAEVRMDTSVIIRLRGRGKSVGMMGRYGADGALEDV